MIRALCARAVSLEATGRVADATPFWATALQVGEAGGYVRVYTNGAPMRLRLLQQAIADPRLAPHARRVLAATDATERATPQLTERQRAVLQLVADGLSDREISGRSEVTVATIKTHLRTIYARLNAHSRTAAVAKARGAGLVQ